MRRLTDSEHDRIFLESGLEAPEMPIYVDPDLEAVDDFALAGEAVGWRRGTRRIILREDVIERVDNGQLRGLVAHEIGHHRGYHGVLNKIWKCLVAVVVLVVFGIGMVGWWLTLDLRVLAALVAALVLFVPLVMLSSSWFSRRLELDADRRAVEILGDSEPIEALCQPAEELHPSGVREWFWYYCHPWPSSSEQLRALRDDE